MSNYFKYQDNYEDLANAIVIQAAMDYRKAYRRYLRGNKSEAPRLERLEMFFGSEWAALLCKDNAKVILEYLQKEQQEKMKKPRRVVKLMPRKNERLGG